MISIVFDDQTVESVYLRMNVVIFEYQGRFPLRKIVLRSDRIGTKFNLLMCLQCQFSIGLRWAVHRYKIASNWAKNWHRRRMFRLNFVPIRSDPRIIFLSGNQPSRNFSNNAWEREVCWYIVCLVWIEIARMDWK